MIEGKIAQLEAEAEVEKALYSAPPGAVNRYDNCMSKWNL